MIMRISRDLARDRALAIATTYAGEIACSDCFEQVDRFVDLSLSGKNAAAAMPQVQDHLERCRDCRQEFQALVTAVQAMA
jgi:hypothetical protein